MLSMTHLRQDVQTLDHSIEEEFDSHIAACIDELVASGLPENEAAAEALRRFGSLENHLARCRREHPQERFPSVNHSLRAIRRARSSICLQLIVLFARYALGGLFLTAAWIMARVATVSGSYSRSDMVADPHRLAQSLPVEHLTRIVADSPTLWNFICAGMATAGTLLVTQRFAKIGAMLAFALLLNLLVFTLAFSFQGTPTLIGAMLLTALLLLLWDLDSFQPLFRKPAHIIALEPESDLTASPRWAWLGVAMLLCAAAGHVLHWPLLVTAQTVAGLGTAVFLLCSLAALRHSGIRSVSDTGPL